MRASGNRCPNRKAVARPTMPPPTMITLRELTLQCRCYAASMAVIGCLLLQIHRDRIRIPDAIHERHAHRLYGLRASLHGKGLGKHELAAERRGSGTAVILRKQRID